MKYILISIAIIVIMMAVVHPGIATRPDPDHKVTICHVPPGNPENANEIEVDENGWNGHDQHTLDYAGKCSSVPPPVPELSPMVLIPAGLLGIVLVSRKFRT